MASSPNNEPCRPLIHGAALDHFLHGMMVGSATTRTADRNLLAVDMVRTGPGEVVETEPLPTQDAFHVVLQLRDLPAHELWLDGRPVRTEHYPRHSVSIVDLSRPSRFRIAMPHEALLFCLPKPALAEVAAEFGTQRCDDLHLPPGVPALDPVMARLGAALLPGLNGRPLEGRLNDSLWADQMLLLVQAHVTRAYGAARSAAARKGSLAAWQERRAKEVIEHGLERPLTLADIAREVSLSPAHFARSFRASTGMTPYGWLTQRRMEVARAMLLAGQEPVASITQAVGYAEQSSFTRAFLRHVGHTPAAFARLHRQGSRRARIGQETACPNKNRSGIRAETPPSTAPGAGPGSLGEFHLNDRGTSACHAPKPSHPLSSSSGRSCSWRPARTRSR